ncbi:hypothetical protein WR25_16938 isoform B [Diploscapter pachys]|uniref:C2H2-type domain-containing protein n=1 Tax=Diploscapter pachys TaxID=2018661 RepID=A0A2A2K2C0_9BILA|nr:hypothetical protein WR25_16938 isoform B [Diploscapter pachys]
MRPAKTARGEYDGAINFSCAAATEDRGAAIGEPGQISCAVCNRRFLSCWALLEHLADFHKMTLFRLEDTTMNEMEQLKNRPAQGMPQINVQPMQMAIPRMSIQQEMLMQTLMQQIFQVRNLCIISKGKKSIY